MRKEIKVKDQGSWIYKERCFNLESAYQYQPICLERVLGLIISVLELNTREGYLNQVAGALNGEGLLLTLSMFDSSDDHNEDRILSTALKTTFSFYKKMLVYSEVNVSTTSTYFKDLNSTQIVRQLGYDFESLSFGIKFYSSKSNVSKWFKVPMEEGRLILNITNSDIRLEASIRKNCEDKNLEIFRDILLLSAEVAEVDSSQLNDYLRLSTSLHRT